ncbi:MULTISPECIES: gas vesicle protein GvpJ [unclassified Rhodococcus (in: high G+C Gram-positive bacteria)]|uniref:gas vesicle protein GvpJ n=1 Tax=unclassified Rhodococcus (in: high G+C Gram-positive bacteria) TaxID=192944 RepID=UPI001639A14E|nr:MULTISPECIES: gas vesicle protein GvpJ [unclassified Rhodococcus (in: high G+C Gram-positive bacteria)]MBC2644383.1 gas vesicle structural protein GvpA [Rhodococcus sp. 3A]MBC2897925.1 gas vesicle structural protein GvpA [Rhodococcus sp. 4CII]
MTTAGGPSSSSLADVIDTILDKGLVIDAYVRVSLVGIELLTIDARVVVASVDTYLRFAEAVNRLEIGSEPKGLSEIVSGGSEHKTKGALEAAGDKLSGLLGGDEEEEPERERVSRKSTRGDR